MNDRQKLWRKFRQKWLRDDVGAKVHEPPWTTPERPLCVWPARRKTRRVVFLSKDYVYYRWVGGGLSVPPDWMVLSRIGVPDEPQMAFMADLHKKLRVPWHYIGDLDTLDLTAFLVMRALNIDFVGRRHALPVTWLGINDTWLALCRRWKDPRWRISFGQMNPLEPEHWSVLREVAPELPDTIGPECTRLLDCGQTLDLAAASGGYKPGFHPRLMKHLVATARTSRRP
ncbi:MAG TPA: hypothetical protein VFA20_17470 [Myxococcaceae bacterium]|nr:hypothetical protein [Myxococcaceae bacterium]